MYKYLIIIFLFLIGISGCSKGWNEEEQEEFINDCVAMNGTETKCFCVLRCLEKEHATYEWVLNNIEKKELSKECKTCIEQCK